MGLRVAVANGNWSSPSTWNAGALPAPGDTVASNGFTVTIDQNIDVDLLTNTVANPVSAVPLMTGDITPSGIVTFSGEFNSGYRAFQVFDRNTGTSWFTGPGTITGWVAYQFTSLKNITAYVVNGDGSNYNAKNWTFEGWDGTSWIILDTVVNSPAGIITRSFVNPNTYIKYRLNITANNGGTAYTSVRDLSFYEGVDSTVASVAGGGFVLTGDYTVTLTNASSGLVANTAGTTNCLVYNGTGTATVNANIYSGSTLTSQAYMFKSGNGTLNFNGILDGNAERALYIANNCGTTNIVGTVRKTGGSITTRSILGVGTGNTINITGNVEANVSGGGSTKQTFISFGSNVINITGNVTAAATNQVYDFAFIPSANDIINVVGTVTGPQGTSLGNNAAIGSTSNPAWYLKVIGSIIGGSGLPAIQNTSGSAINIFSGPFISSANGIQPFYVARMHYQRTLGSYYEFRDSSTNGALPPAAAAPTTRLNSPEVGSDLPAVANVRFGTTYGYGSLTGTLRMPHPNQVTYGVAVDNTFGTAVLTAASVWDYLVANITVENSIGMRLKNVATPQTTGSQLAALL